MAFIRQQKQGNRTYYWLVESYRDGETGKVRTRKLRYLGATKPPRPYSDRQFSLFPRVDLKYKFAVGRYSSRRREKTPAERKDDAIRMASGASYRLDSTQNFNSSEKFILVLLRDQINEVLKIKPD